MVNAIVDFAGDNLISIFCLVSMVVFFFVNKESNISVKQYFFVLGAIVVLEIIRSYFDGISTGIPKFILACIGYILRPLLMYIIALTMLRNHKIITRILVGIPLLVDVFLILFGSFLGDYVYTLTEDDYSFGPGLEFVKYTIVYFLLLIVVAAFMRCNKSKWEAIIVLVACAFIVINFLDQVIYHFWSYDYQNAIISLSVFIYYMYFSAQKHIVQIDEKDDEISRTKIQTTIEIADQAIETLAYTIDAKDKYTRGHSVRVAKYARMIAERTGMSPEECHEIYLTGLLHDIGKISILDSVINKPGKLTEDEFAQIKQHPVIGAKILEKMGNTPYLRDGAKYHHERYDGKGYPCGLRGEEIPVRARMIAVADAYDAMTSYRSYRGVMDQSLVRQEIWKGVGTQFDPDFAKIMISFIDADVDYDMREKTEVSDEILTREFFVVDGEERSILSLNDEDIHLQKTDAKYFGTFIKMTDIWASPVNHVKMVHEITEFSFTSITYENAGRIWDVPCLIFYASEDGEVGGEEYMELAVVKATGYGWRVYPAMDDHEDIIRKATFTSWDDWILDNKKGMLYNVSVSRTENILYATMENHYLKVDIRITVPADFDEDIYVAITGEKCAITGFDRR